MEEMGRSNEERQRDPRGWADVILMRPSSAWGHYACQDLVRTLRGWCAGDGGRGTGASQTRRDQSTWHATVPLSSVTQRGSRASRSSRPDGGMVWLWWRVVALEINGAQQNPKTVVPSEERQEEDRRLAMDAAAPVVDVHAQQHTVNGSPSVTAPHVFDRMHLNA